MTNELSRPALVAALWSPARPGGVPLERLDAAAARAAAHGADLLVSGERALRTRPDGAAEASDGHLAAGAAAIARAHGLALVVGYEEACSGRAHSAALVLEADGGAIGNARRSHTARDEADRPAAGHWLSVAALALPDRAGDPSEADPGRLRLGILIGLDLVPPEPARCLALAGIDLLVVLGAADPPPWLPSLAIARAAENGVPLLLAGLPGATGAAHADDGTALPLERLADDLVLARPRRTGGSPALGLRRPRLYAALVVD